MNQISASINYELNRNHKYPWETYEYNWSNSISYERIEGQTGLFNIGMATNLEKGKTMNSNQLYST